MGVDRNLYFGPYVKCKAEFVEKEISDPGCTKCNKKHESASFCPTCGSPIGKLVRKERDTKVDTWDLVERMKEKLSNVWSPYESSNTWGNAGFDYYIPNVEVKGIGGHTPDKGDHCGEDDDFALPISADLIERELEKFGEFFKKELAMLKKEYGDYTIAWGIMQWYS